MPLTITDQHLAEMQENGYTIFENVFTAEEMSALAERVDAYEARMREELAASGGNSGISRANEITFNDHLAERDEELRKFARRPEWIEITTKFLGSPDIDLYWNQTVFKHPEGERVFPWHQDDGYTRVTPFPYLTLWLAVNDATPENGCVSVMPGSHKSFVEHTWSDLGWVCHSNDDPNQGVLVPAKAGSIVAFWSLTMHKSGANRSQGIRKAYVLQYCAQGLRNMESNELVEALPVARGGVAVTD